jgi:hypothetical protein
MAPRGPERLTIEPAMLLQATHKVPPLVPKPLQHSLGRIPGIKEDRLGATAQVIPRIAEQL